MKDEKLKTSYELLRVGDLVQYIDPIPEDLRIIERPGIVIEIQSSIYLKVKWLDRDIKPGLYLRRELKLLSRAYVPKIPRKNL